VDSRAAGALPLELLRALGEPRLQAKVSDLEYAHAVLVLAAEPITDAPILDLRLRKGARRRGVKLERAGGLEPSAVRELAGSLSQAGEDVVLLWGERLTAGPNGAEAAAALVDLAAALSMDEVEGAGLLEIPSTTNGRGLREAGVLPNAGPGLSAIGEDGLDAGGIAAGLLAGELSAVYLLGVDPLARADPFGAPACPHGTPEGPAWEQALGRAAAVIAHASSLSEGVREHASVVFPAETYAEKAGTVTHPDGRIQRLRPAIAHPGATRAEWLVIAQLAALLALDLGVLGVEMATAQLIEAVPFYAGLTLEEIGGKGVRWQEREAAGAYPTREPLA
jgi:NADH-quinone oxidoreductase subunit G